VDYTITSGNSLIVYLDTTRGTGATNVSALNAWSRHLDFLDGFNADLMICQYEAYGSGHIPEVWRFVSNALVQNISGLVAQVASGNPDGGSAAMEVGIPWNAVYASGSSVPLGAVIRMVAVITGGDGTNACDAAPDNILRLASNGWSHLSLFYDFCIDCDSDTVPDNYASGFAIPEFSTILVVPMIVFIVLLVGARKRKH